MIFLTGDTHGVMNRFSSNRFPEGNKLSNNDYIIVLGDFGLYWNDGDEEQYWKKWLSKKKWTTLWVDGNHENFPLMREKTEEIEMFGGKVDIDKEYPSIIHLKRGEVYSIEGKTFFVMGGANSADKIYRRIGISWWEEEMPSYSEYENGLNNLNKEVDFILSHTTDFKTLGWLKENGVINDITSEEFSLNMYLYHIKEDVEFKHHYFAHFHIDMDIDEKTHCLYQEIRRV
jgi:hypothetical protein